MQEGSKIYLMAPIERKGQDSFEDIFNEIRSAGYLRVRIDGKLYTLENIPEIDHRRKHNVEVVIDRLVIKSGMRTRICDAVESGLDLGKGMLHVAHVDDQFAEETWKIDKYSQHFPVPNATGALSHLTHIIFLSIAPSVGARFAKGLENNRAQTLPCSYEIHP